MADSSPARRPDLVLVVDDEPSIVTAFTKILDYEGYATVPAHTAEDALRLLESGVKPDVILLDLRMPGVGGLGLLLSLRANEGSRAIPVAVVTADTHLDGPTQQAVEALGAVLCYKPMNIDQVVALTAQLVDQKNAAKKAEVPAPPPVRRRTPRVSRRRERSRPAGPRAHRTARGDR